MIQNKYFIKNEHDQIEWESQFEQKEYRQLEEGDIYKDHNDELTIIVYVHSDNIEVSYLVDNCQSMNSFIPSNIGESFYVLKENLKKYLDY